MLTAEAARLAAIEILCPTASIQQGSGFPTLAGINVLDSREIKINELEQDKPYTPVLALFTTGAGQQNRGDIAAGIEFDTTCTLEVVGELAVSTGDEEDPNAAPVADALAGDDPEARLVLAAMMSQVKFLLEEALESRFFRRFIRSILQVEEEWFAVPQLGLRWQRVTHRYTLAIGDDHFDFETGKPKALADLISELPEQSYAREKLQQLFDHFQPQVQIPLEVPDVMQGEDLVSIEDRKDPNS